MRRYLFALGMLATVAASQSPAGYYIVRIVLAGGAEVGAADGSGVPGLTPGGPGAFAPSAGGRGGGFPPPPGTNPDGGYAQPGVDPSVPLVGDPTKSIVVVVPFNIPYARQDFYLKNTQRQRWDYVFKHGEYRTNLFFDSTIFQLYADFQNVPEPPPLYPKGTRTFTSNVQLHYGNLVGTEMNPKDFDPQKLFELIREALEHGMASEAVTYTEKLLAYCEKKKPATSAEVAKFLEVYRKIQGPLKARPAPTREGDDWQTRLDVGTFGAKTRSQGHYVLIYWDASEAELAQRFSRLEDNFKGFFLTHAMQGIELKVPTQPLVAVCLRSSDEFYPARVDFGQAKSMPLTDAFFVPDYKLLVIAPDRTDGLGRSFRMSNQRVFAGGMSRQALLTGTGPELDTSMDNPNGPGGAPGTDGRGGTGGLIGPGGPGGQPQLGPDGQPLPVQSGKKTKDEVAQAMTLAMVELYDHNATEIAAVSCEGSMQLMYATNQLPQYVDLPTWLTIGARAYFLRPHEAVYTPGEKDKATMAVALTTGYGRPNYVMQHHYRSLEAKNALYKDPAVFLRNVVSDSYFDAAAAGRDLDNPGASPKADSAEEMKRLAGFTIKARASAWALYYYLAKYRPMELQAYFRDLSNLPRDLPLDGNTKMRVFARSFHLVDKDGEPDLNAFGDFARGWLGTISGVPEAWVNVEVTTPPPAAAAAGGSTPGPGGPRPSGPAGPGGPTGSRD